MTLQKFNVTVTVFNPAEGIDSESTETYILPVNGPDAEHAASSAMANVVSFTTKLQAGKALPVAFCATDVSPRP